MLHLDLHLYHSTRFARPGASPWSPQYTCLTSVFLLIFQLNYQSYTLTCTYGMALGQLARGKPPGPPSAYTLTFTYAMALTALSQVARGNRHTHAYSVHMLNPTLGTHVKSQF